MFVRFAQAWRAAVLWIAAACLVPAAWGQEHYADPLRFVKWPAQDAGALLDVLASERVLFAAGVGGVLLLAAPHDATMSAEVAGLLPHDSELAIKILEEVGNVKAVRPLAILVFAGSLMSGDQRFQDAAFTSLEAVVVSNLVTNTLKLAFGRARPWQEEGPLAFDPFSGNTSFPSGHATTAFAVVTPWLLYYPNAFTPGLLVLSVGSALTRVVTRFHWPTDIAAGAAIGFATAYWLTRRHQQSGRRVVLAPSLDPDQVGVRVQVRLGP